MVDHCQLYCAVFKDCFPGINKISRKYFEKTASFIGTNYVNHLKKRIPSWYTKFMNCRNNKVSSDVEEDQQIDEALDLHENRRIDFEWDSFEYRFNICLGLSFELLIGSYYVRKEFYMKVA